MRFERSAWIIGAIVGVGMLSVTDSVWAVNGWDNPDNYQDNWSQSSQPSNSSGNSGVSIGKNDGSFNGNWSTDLNGNGNSSGSNNYSGNFAGNSNTGGYSSGGNAGNANNNGGDDTASNNNNSNADNHSNQNSGSSSSSASSSSSSLNGDSHNDDHHESHQRTYTQDDLIKMAKARGNRVVKNVKAGNKQRVLLNTQRGAIDLTNSYHQQVEIIKNKKITKAQRQAQLQGQVGVLQKALNTRLANLQNGYNGEVKDLRTQIDHLPANHQHDGDAIGLQDKLAQSDYQLGKQSNQAYSRYNKAVAQLNKAQTSKKTREEQLAQAKQAYNDNLAANQAVAPKTLKKQNAKRLREAKAFRRAIIAAAESHQFNTPSDVKHFSMHRYYY